MKNRYKHIKMCICIFDAVCVFLCILFSYQIMLCTTEIVVMFEGNNKKIYQSENRQMINLQELVNEHAEIQKEINETAKTMEEVERKYHLRSYIDGVSAEISESINSSVYVEKYFKIERGELQQILSEFDAEGKWETDFFDIELSDSVLPIGDKVWLRYCDEDRFATGITVQNPESNISYKNISAGMFIDDIRKQLSGLVVEKMDYNGKTTYYLEVREDDFLYYFFSIGGRNEPTILYIEKTDR